MSKAAQSFDVYHKWLGIPPAESANGGPNHYRLLGITLFEEDADVIETAAEQRMALVRSRQTGKHGAASQKLLNEIAAARLELLQPERKKAYDESLRQANAQKAAPQLPAASAPSATSANAAPALVVQPRAAAKPASSKFRWLLMTAAGGAALLTVVFLIAIPFLNWGPQPTIGSAGSNVAAPHPNVPDPKSKAPASPPPAQESTARLPTPAAEPGPAPSPEPISPSSNPPAPEAGISPAPAAVVPAEPVEAPAEASPANDEAAKPPAESPGPPAPNDAGKDPASDEPSESPAVAPAFQPRAPDRAEVPDAPSLEKAREAVREIYAAQFAAAKTPEQKSKLAAEILGQAQVTFDDPAGKYVLLDTARRVGEQAGDLDLCLRAADQLEQSFQVDVLPLKESSLEATRKLARQTDDWRRLAEVSLAVADEALEASQYESAQRLVDSAVEWSRKSRDKDLIARAVSRSKEVTQLATAYAQARDAFEKLRTSPDDAASHLVVGKFLCFAKGDWPKGLEHLAKGSDQQLAKLATDELKAESNSESWVKLGDQWLEYAKTLKEAEKVAAERRTAWWYSKALPGLTGLSRIKVGKALESLPKADGADASETGATTVAAKTEIPAAVADGRLLMLFEDQPEFPSQMTEGEGTIVLEEQDVFRGDAALKVTPKERFGSYLPGVGARIREKPGPGEYRYLRFAWKKSGGSQIGVQLHRSESERGKLPGEAWVRYHAGPAETFLDANSIRVGTKPPAEWAVVTRDLYADYGEFTISGLALTPLDGDFGLFDHVYLARELKDLNELGKSPPPRSAGSQPRKRGAPANPPRPELGLIGKWTITYESGGVRHYEFDGKGLASFVEERRMGRIYLKGNDVVLEFDDGKLERLRLVNGMILVEHYDPATRYPDSPTSRGRLEPTR